MFTALLTLTCGIFVVVCILYMTLYGRKITKKQHFEYCELNTNTKSTHTNEMLTTTGKRESSWFNVTLMGLNEF